MTIQDEEQHAANAIDAGAYEEAVRLLLPLAQGGSEYALLTLGWVHETGATGVADKNNASHYYERAATIGSVSAYLYLGRLLLRDGKIREARAAFERGVELGSEECTSELVGLENEEAERLAANAIEAGAYEEAARLLQPLAAANSEYALISLGWIYETGGTGVADKDAARLLYQRAAEEGSASGFFELGRLLLSQGREIEARLAFKCGAERGNVPSMSRLGRMMVEGRGGPADIGEGSAWLSQAASRGHIFAQRTLLGMEGRNARSLLGKWINKLKVAFLAGRGAREMLSDPGSDNVR